MKIENKKNFLKEKFQYAENEKRKKPKIKNFRKKRKMKICVKEENRERIEERKCVRCKYCVDLPEIGVFVSCMVACGVVGFVLRAFSAP